MSGTPGYDQFTAVIESESAAFVTACDAGLDRDVPSCPGWHVADLARHVGRVQRFAAMNVEAADATQSVPRASIEGPPDDAGLVEWVRAGARRLVDSLKGADADTSCWTWTPDKTARFWARRQAHEIAVHRHDAQLAVATPTPIEPGLAVDGIQEVFDIVEHRPTAPDLAGHGESLHLHSTDADGEWLVVLSPRGLSVTNEHAKGDAAVRAPAADLLLYLWGRIESAAPPPGFEVFGDTDLVARFQRRIGV